MHPTAFAKKYLLLWEAGQSTFSLLVAIRYFGWGPVGKVRLILEKLPQARVALYGDARTISLTTKLLGSRHKFSEHPPQRSEVALVIHDRPAAKNIADLNVPVVASARLPDGLTSRERDRPCHEVAHVRHDLNRLPGRRADGRGGELGRDVPEHFGGAVGERCDEMTDHRARRIGSRQWLGRMCRLHDASVHAVPGTCNTKRNGD